MEGKNQFFLTVLLSAGSAALVVLLSLNLFRSGDEQLEERMVKVHDPYIPGLCYGSGLTESEYQEQYPPESWNVLDQEYVFEPSGFGGTCRMSKIKVRQKSRQQVAALKRESQERDREQARVKREEAKERKEAWEAKQKKIKLEKMERRHQGLAENTWEEDNKVDSLRSAQREKERVRQVDIGVAPLPTGGRSDYVSASCYGSGKWSNLKRCIVIRIPDQGVRAITFEYQKEGKKYIETAGDPLMPHFPSSMNFAKDGWKSINKDNQTAECFYSPRISYKDYLCVKK